MKRCAIGYKGIHLFSLFINKPGDIAYQIEHHRTVTTGENIKRKCIFCYKEEQSL